MSKYNSFEEIERDLKRLDLERKIAKEEMIGLKYELKEELSPYFWWLTFFEMLKRYGVILLVKKLLKRKSTRD
jgi:hypothetical protein